MSSNRKCTDNKSSHEPKIKVTGINFVLTEQYSISTLGFGEMRERGKIEIKYCAHDVFIDNDSMLYTHKLTSSHICSYVYEYKLRFRFRIECKIQSTLFEVNSKVMIEIGKWDSDLEGTTEWDQSSPICLDETSIHYSLFIINLLELSTFFSLTDCWCCCYFCDWCHHCWYHCITLFGPILWHPLIPLT